MISIYTHTNNPLKPEFWRFALRKISGKYSGPDAVLDSLTKGLEEIHVPFEINPLKPKYNIIHVLSGVEALRERIHKKAEDQTLIAGPTLVTTPDEFDGILSHGKIDLILTPSDWVTDFYGSMLPTLTYKILSWPAGVEIPKNTHPDRTEVLVFKKNIEEEVYTKVVTHLEEKQITYKVLEYGKFSHQEYTDLLRKTTFVIYLQKTESQGIALQEAWAHNVPTLVYRSLVWKYKDYVWENEHISAPYLTPQSGLFFTLETLEESITQMSTQQFEPRAYCEEHLSNKKSAEKLIKIIKQHAEKNH
ncbi:MAG: hypothetical protein V4686_03045 [Patescibacteria group bacterium]